MPQDDWLSQLKDKADIVDIVSKYATLNQKGSNFWTCCPFHGEKTPSFAVNQARQAYHCFGCGESGDVIKFIEKIESVSFMDAVKILADKVGFEIPTLYKSSGDTSKGKERRDRLYQLMTDTARFYYSNLKLPGAKDHNEYMQRRGIDGAIAVTFGIGASVDYGSLIQFLRGRGYADEEMKACGVAGEKNGKLYDSLGGRLIFPIINGLGQVVAFGGRELKKTDFAKYKNTAETEIFSKSNVLYALNQVKKFNRGTLDSIVIVEGYMDTISLYAAGLKNVVASMGTALTDGQAKQIKRMTNKVYISYDGDSAGQKATMRGLDILTAQDIDVRVIELPEGLDPDDVVKKQGSAAYFSLIKKALPLTEYKLKMLKKSYDLSDKVDKRKYVLDALKVISKLVTATEREDYLKQLSHETGFTYDSLERDMSGNIAENQSIKTAITDKSYDGEDKAARFIVYCKLFHSEFFKGIEDVSKLIDSPYYRKIFEMSGKMDEIDEDELEQIKSAGNGFSDVDKRAYFGESLMHLRVKNLDMQSSIIAEQLKVETDADERKRLGHRLTENILSKQNLKK